jgi:hypothetical protein
VTLSFARASEITKNIPYDRVIVCTGFRFDASIFHADCRPALTIRDRFPAQTSEWESTNIPDLYFAGTLTQVRDYKKSTSGFIHGFRYGVRALYHMLQRKYYGAPWPSRCLPADPEDLMDAVIARVNRSSALWQLFGFSVRSDRRFSAGCRVLRRSCLSPMYTRFSMRPPATSQSHLSTVLITISLILSTFLSAALPKMMLRARTLRRYLHPVVRHFSRGALLSEHHVTENLENEWTDPITHRDPLRIFLHNEMTAPKGQTAELVTA